MGSRKKTATKTTRRKRKKQPKPNINTGISAPPSGDWKDFGVEAVSSKNHYCLDLNKNGSLKDELNLVAGAAGGAAALAGKAGIAAGIGAATAVGNYLNGSN